MCDNVCILVKAFVLDCVLMYKTHTPCRQQQVVTFLTYVCQGNKCQQCPKLFIIIRILLAFQIILLTGLHLFEQNLVLANEVSTLNTHCNLDS